MTFAALVIGVASPKSPMRIGNDMVTFPPLAGVAGDVREVVALLRGAGATVEEPITTPAKTSASNVARAILTRLDALAVGDTLLVYFSGHGYRVPDPKSASRYSEMLVCADAPIDDDFAATIRSRVKEGTRLIMIIDACHAGGFRLAYARRTKPLTFFEPRVGSEILWWSAALAKEDAIQTTAKNSVVSAFTMSLVDAWKSKNGTSYRDLWDEVWHEFVSKFGTRGQTPMLILEGPDDSLLDAIAFGAPPRPAG